MPCWSTKRTWTRTFPTMQHRTVQMSEPSIRMESITAITVTMSHRPLQLPPACTTRIIPWPWIIQWRRITRGLIELPAPWHCCSVRIRTAIPVTWWCNSTSSQLHRPFGAIQPNRMPRRPPVTRPIIRQPLHQRHQLHLPTFSAIATATVRQHNNLSIKNWSHRYVQFEFLTLNFLNF